MAPQRPADDVDNDVDKEFDVVLGEVVGRLRLLGLESVEVADVEKEADTVLEGLAAELKLL